MKRAVLLAVAAVTLCVAQAVQARTIPVVADTFVDASHPNNVYGGKPFLRTDDKPRKIMLLRFPTATRGPITLCLTVGGGVGSAVPIAYTVRDPWNEDTVTWNTRPRLGHQLRGWGAWHAGLPYRMCLRFTKGLPKSVALVSGGIRATRYGADSAQIGD